MYLNEILVAYARTFLGAVLFTSVRSLRGKGVELKPILSIGQQIKPSTSDMDKHTKPIT